MHREVFALLYKDSKDAPPLLPTDTGKKKNQYRKDPEYKTRLLQDSDINRQKQDWE